MTAEAAVLLPVLAVLLIAAMWAVGVVLASVRCIDAARDAALVAARGESIQSATEVGARAAPPGAEIEISHDGPEVVTVVRARVTLDWFLLSGLPPIKVEGRSVVRAEPGVGEAPPSSGPVLDRSGARARSGAGVTVPAGPGVPEGAP